MSVRTLLTDDGSAVLLLCSGLGLPTGASASAPQPLTLAEWNQLALAIQRSAIGGPAGLLGKDADTLAAELGGGFPDLDRVARLLERNVQLALELSRLAELGIWAVTRVDPDYPGHLRATLKRRAPAVLCGAGEIALLRSPGIAVIGSRGIDEAGADFARRVGAGCGRAGIPVISGGARGTDRLAMDGSLEAGGGAVGVLADSLVRTIRGAEVRQFLSEGRLVLLTPYSPRAGFSIGAAMGRNKVIYGLADVAVVVASEYQSGGTWAGAVEAIKSGWNIVLSRIGPNVPRGNRELVKLGASEIDESVLESGEDGAEDLPRRLRRIPATRPGGSIPLTLFPELE
jgi:predicted Rossmann fold nucleotide-binding protein DprA/Smf involved in DNA uptake